MSESSRSVAQPLVQASLIGEAIDRGPALVLVADEDMRYVAVNQYACELLGYAREELLELRVSDVWPWRETAERYADFVESGNARGTARIVAKGGGEVSVLYEAQRTTIAGLTFYVSVAFVERSS